MTLAWEVFDGQNGQEIGHQLLERLYWQETGQPLPEILKERHGKPYFKESDWYFSLSHTQKHVFCVLSKHNVGLDAEEIGRNVSDTLLEGYTSENEKARLGDNPQDAFLRLWVMKEAEAKRTGRGIGTWMKDTDFDPYDGRIQVIDGCYVAIVEDAYVI